MPQSVAPFGWAQQNEIWALGQSRPDNFPGYPNIFAGECNAGQYYLFGGAAYKCLLNGNYFTPEGNENFEKYTF